MLYAICAAKNKIAANEKNPVYTPDNWEIRKFVKCRKNASHETWEQIFLPAYKAAANGVNWLSPNGHSRFWHFPESELMEGEHHETI